MLKVKEVELKNLKSCSEKKILLKLHKTINLFLNKLQNVEENILNMNNSFFEENNIYNELKNELKILHKIDELYR
jgi:hypothetical protein